jgi:hypothetical protein
LPRGKKKEILPSSISEQEVFDVFDFAKNMYNIYPNVFTPELVNSRMKDINMNPLSATAEGIDKALLDPNSSEKELIGYSQFFELTDMLYKRMLLYLGNMLSFDPIYTCVNAKDKDYTSPAYKKDLAILQNFLDKFDMKQEFKKVLRQLVRKETYFCVLREDSKKYILQELPQDYCLITGRWDYGILFDFNMYWFIQPAVDLNSYPSIFKKKYKDIFGKENGLDYKPSASINRRNGSYVYYIQTSPKDNFWAWKFIPEIATEVPFLSPLFPDLVLKPLVRKLQTNIYILQAQKVMVGLIPMLKDTKGSSVKDQIGISSEVLGKFLGLLKQGLSDAIKVGGVPFDDIKSLDFDGTDKNIMENYTKNTSSMSGINSRLLFATDKMTAEETRNSISVDSYMMETLYPYFADFLNYHANKNTSKFKWKFSFKGTEFDMDKTNRRNTAMELAKVGIFLPQLIANSLGMLPQDLERMLDEAKAGQWDKKLIPLVSIYQQSGNADKGGRPTSEESGKPISDSAQDTRDNSSNIGRGGKI